MSLANVAWAPVLGWADPELRSLEAQIRVPLFNQAPVEMGLAGCERQMLERLARDARYPALFARAFPDEPAPIRLENVVRAIASFERTLVSGSSPFDRLLFLDDRTALSEEAWRGLRLFRSERLGCSGCHGGLFFAGSVRIRPAGPAPAAPEEALFHNTALYDLDGAGRYPPGGQGLFEHTGDPADMGRFRVPSLRNVARTAPYMHDGSVPTLEAVVAHYAQGGRAPGNPLKSPRLQGFAITTEETRALLAFLESLTDEDFLDDPRFADPFSDSASDPLANRSSTPSATRSSSCARPPRWPHASGSEVRAFEPYRANSP